MNDILAPIFAIFVAERFNMNYIELENNIRKVEAEITDSNLLHAEADAFHCFSLFLSTMKQNYVKGFDGVHENLKKVKELLTRSDKDLAAHLDDNDIEVFHFGFR